MSVSNGQPITQALVDALATLADTKIPGFNTFGFPPFRGSDAIALPVKVTPTAAYGSGGFVDSQQVTLWLFPYKTIAGNKTYAYSPVTSDFTGHSGSGNFTITWTWVSPIGTTSPDGYVVVSPLGTQYEWKDIGNVQTLTEDGNYLTWTLDESFNDNGTSNTPCSVAIWLKMINRIHQASCLATDISCLNAGDVTGLQSTGGIGPYDGSITTLGINGLVSGPWCVAVGDVLNAWVSRPSIFITPGLGARTFSPGYTQNYKSIKFYFRAQDGPSVNITAQNQLTTYAISSDAPVTTTAHYHLRIVSCSDGHIKVQDSGGGTVRTDMDVTTGTVYDISFDIAGTSPQTPPLPKSLDFTFTTADATGLGVAAVGLEYSNDVRSIDIPDSYCEIEFNNYVTTNGPGEINSAQLCTTCLQLVLTETNHIVGIWTATTIPTLGNMPYLDQDLPNYLPQNVFPADTRRVPLDASKPYIPLVNNRGVLWPVFRDTDFTPDSVLGQPVKGSKAWQVLGTKYVSDIQITLAVNPSGVASNLTYFDSFVSAGTFDLRVLVPVAGLTIYAKAGDFPTIADFDVTAPSGAWFSLATAVPGFATDTTWYFGLLNPGTSVVNTIATLVTIADNTAPNGTFFPTDMDNLGVVAPKMEGYSYKFSDPTHVGNYPIPLMGYCINTITVRRLPVDNGSGIFLAPSTGTSALVVKLGIKAGFGWATSGTFVELLTLTIPAGQPEVTMAVFLPVLSGTPLAYQSDAVAIVRASVNFQPQMHSTFLTTTVTFNGSPRLIGYYNGSAWYDQNKAMLSFKDGIITEPIVLPISATVYNDLTAVLNLLP